MGGWSKKEGNRKPLEGRDGGCEVSNDEREAKREDFGIVNRERMRGRFLWDRGWKEGKRGVAVGVREE